jgi:hypothetical protein
MKIELLDLREQIKEKDIIINNLIINSKSSKVQDLDDKYSKTYQELLEVSALGSTDLIFYGDFYGSHNYRELEKHRNHCPRRPRKDNNRRLHA